MWKSVARDIIMSAANEKRIRFLPLALSGDWPAIAFSNVEPKKGRCKGKEGVLSVGGGGSFSLMPICCVMPSDLGYPYRCRRPHSFWAFLCCQNLRCTCTTLTGRVLSFCFMNLTRKVLLRPMTQWHRINFWHFLSSFVNHCFLLATFCLIFW